MSTQPTLTALRDANFSLQEVAAGFKALAAVAERADLLHDFREAAVDAELAERRVRIDAREHRRQRHHRKTAAVKFLR